MKQPAAAAEWPIQAQFLGEQPGQVRHFHRMPQHVLGIAGPEVQSSQVVDQLLVQADHVRLERRLFAQPMNMTIHVFMGLLDDLLDPRRVDSAVLDQLLERQLGDLAANAVESRDDDDAGRVVDDHVDAGRFLERANVAPLAADDAALHVVVGDVDRAHRHFRRVRRRVPLNRRGEDLAGLLQAAFLRQCRVFEHPISHLGRQLGFDSLQQELARLFRRHPRDARERLDLHRDDLLELGLAL